MIQHDEEDKPEDDLQRLRASMDQEAMHVQEAVPVLAALFRSCIRHKLPPDTASCITQIYFNHMLRPDPIL